MFDNNTQKKKKKSQIKYKKIQNLLNYYLYGKEKQNLIALSFPITEKQITRPEAFCT